MRMIGQQVADRAQLHLFIVSAVIPWQEPAREAGEGWMTQEIADRVFGAQMTGRRRRRAGLPENWRSRSWP